MNISCHIDDNDRKPSQKPWQLVVHSSMFFVGDINGDVVIRLKFTLGLPIESNFSFTRFSLLREK